MKLPASLALVFLLLAPPLLAETPARAKGKRESDLSKAKIDAAITEAQDAAVLTIAAVRKALAEGGKDAKRREAKINDEMAQLSDALARLREGFDDDDAWTDQKAEVRLAWSKWKLLDPLIRHHWASDSRDEFEILHEALRNLTRIYQVDSPART